MNNISIKKAILIILLFQSAHCLSQKSTLFLKAGINIASFTSENAENFYEVNSVVSFNAGLVGEIEISKTILFRPSLIISGKGAKTKGGEPPYNNTYFTAVTRPYYIELPVNIVYKIPFEKNSSLFLGGGFYGSLGIAGKNKVSGQTVSTGSFSDEKKIEFGKGPTSPDFHNWAGIGYMNKGDYGINVTGGLHIKKFLVSIQYQLGLKNIDYGTRVDKDENKNRVFSFSIGWQVL